MPYIGFRSLAGDHEKRQGFWNFYDHWDDYEEWLGPRPAEDPTTWLVRDLEGDIAAGICGGYSPDYFAPLHRYQACPNNPNWHNFLRTLCRLAAECDYDGIFPDNTTYGGDYCEHCQARFRKFLAESYEPAEIERLCGTRRLDDIRLENEGVDKRVVHKFRLTTLKENLASLRAAGAEVKPGFQIFPNVGSLDRYMVMSEACDLFMFEGSYTPGRVGDPAEAGLATWTLAIEIAEGAEVKTSTVEQQVREGAIFAELGFKLTYPHLAPPDGGEVTVEVTSVGASLQDADALLGMQALLTNVADGSVTEVPVPFENPIGNAVPRAVHPPQTATAKLPKLAPGTYSLALTYQYRDAEHLDVADGVMGRIEALVAGNYHTHIGQLLQTIPGGARPIVLHYGGKGRGLELLMAECAAFSSGGAPPCKDGTLRARYAGFFRAHPDLYEGLHPWGQVGVMFAYWGGNPGHMGRIKEPLVADALTQAHRLPVPLWDEYLAGPQDLAGLEALYLVCKDYEMSEAGLAALREFAKTGGKIVAQKLDTTMNGLPLAEAMSAEPEQWSWAAPGFYGPSLLADDRAQSGLRLAAYRGEGKLVLHALNYDLALADDDPQPEPTEATEVILPLPEGAAATSAVAYSPDFEGAREVRVSGADGGAKLTLPPVSIYTVVAVDLG